MPGADREAPIIKVIELRLLPGPLCTLGCCEPVSAILRDKFTQQQQHKPHQENRRDIGCEIRMNIQLVDFSVPLGKFHIISA